MIHSADGRESGNRDVVDPKGHEIGVLEAICSAPANRPSPPGRARSRRTATATPAGRETRSAARQLLPQEPTTEVPLGAMGEPGSESRSRPAPALPVPHAPAALGSAPPWPGCSAGRMPGGAPHGAGRQVEQVGDKE